ncbi:MAG: ABC transporter permease [Candidatus Thorarchaeota archaeon]|nr:MAG: ABC transporter permease [Candidatus Thorarchaeota archaeon]
MSRKVSSHRIRTVIRRIFRQIRRDRPTLGLLLIAPLLITVLWSFILTGAVSNVPTAVCVQDNPLEDSLGTTVSSLFEDHLNVTVFQRDRFDAFDELGESIQAVLLLPSNLTEGLIRGGNVTLNLYINVTSEAQANFIMAVIGNVTTQAAGEVFGSRGIQLERNVTFTVPLPPSPLDFSFNLSLVNEDIGFVATIGGIFQDILSEDGNVSVIDCDSRETVVRLLENRSAVAGVYVGADLTSTTINGEDQPIELFINGIQTVEATSALAAVQNALSESVAQAFGREGEARVSVTYIYGEAGISMIEIMGPAIIGFMGVFFGFLIPGIFFLRERQQGTLERMQCTPLTDLEIVLGYSIAFIGVLLVQTTVISLVVLYLSPQLLSSILTLIPLVVLLAMGSVTLAILISYRMKNELQVIQTILVFILPQMFLSGLLFPLSQLPSYIAMIPYIFPLTYYVEAARAVAFYNATLLDEIIPVMILVLYCLLGIAASVVKRSDR